MSASTSARSRVGRLPLFAFAIGGLLVGHAASYLIALPDPYHRDLVLRRTGHAYLPTVAELALVVGVAAVASLVAHALGRGPHRVPSFPALATRLASLQVVAFAGQEVAERVVARASLADLLADHVLAVGVGVQIVVALAGAGILRWCVRASNRAAAIVRTRRAPLPRPQALPLVAMPVTRLGCDRRRAAFAVRGPPSA